MKNKKHTEVRKVDVTIVGAGLSGLTTAFYLAKAGKKVMVLEKKNHIGGVIRTVHKDGFIFETGPNTGVYSTPDLVRLFDDLEGAATPEFANPKGKQRWIRKKGKWHALPSGLSSAVGTPLFTFRDKLRILGEPFRKKGTDPYESVAQLVRRRMGKSFLNYAVDPFISGIYAGDPEKLVTQFALPKLYRLEQDYGSFIRGAVKKRKEPKDALTQRATREVFSVEDGLQQLTEALGDKIGRDQILTGVENLEISRDQNEFRATFTSAGREYQVTSGHVVTTIPGQSLENMFSFIDGAHLQPVLDLRYAKVVQVIAAFRKWEGIPLDAFGGLIPSREKRDALGILFTSSIFKNRTPEGGAVLSVFMGGDRKPEVIEKTDAEIRAMALKEINETLGKPAKLQDREKLNDPEADREQDMKQEQQPEADREQDMKQEQQPDPEEVLEPQRQKETEPDLQPDRQAQIEPEPELQLAMEAESEPDMQPYLQPDHLEIFRYPYAIPQYEASTEQRLEAIERIETAYPGIHLAGNIRDGIGIADRVKQGYQVAQEIIAS